MVKMAIAGTSNRRQVSSKQASGKVEPKAHRASPAGVNQMGVSTAFKKTPIIQGRGYEPKPVPATGFLGAVKGHAGPGPGGGGRTIYPTGGQGTYGPVNPGSKASAPDIPATGRTKDILSMYGPEIKRR